MPIRRPRLIAGVELVAVAADTVLVRTELEDLVIEGVDAHFTIQVAALADGSRILRDIAALVGKDRPESQIDQLVTQLAEIVFEEDVHGEKSSPRGAVAVLGDSDGARRIGEGLTSSRLVTVERFLLDDAGLVTSIDSPAETLSLDRLFARVDYLVCAIDDAPISRSLLVNQAALKSERARCVFLSVQRGKLVVGPLIGGQNAACFVCSQLLCCSRPSSRHSRD
jgi:hypothetical protein